MIEGLHFVRSVRPGKPIRYYVYAWRGGPCIMKADSPKRPKLTPEALEAYRKVSTATRPDTIKGMIRDWQRSPEWRRLAANTEKNWTPVLNRIEAKWGETPLSVWSDPRMVVKVIAWRDEAQKTPRAADYRVGVLRSLLEWGRLHGKVTVNVANGIPQLYDGGDRAEIIWTDDDRKAFARAANRAVTDALELACRTGLRLADLAGLTWNEVGDHAIIRVALKASKRKRRRAVVPLTERTKAFLKELKTRSRAEGVDTVLVTTTGKSWSSGGLGQRVGEARDKANIRHEDGRAKHLHDCRGTFATELMLADLTDAEIAEIMAWTPERVAAIRRRYVDQTRTIIRISERMASGQR